MKWPVVVVGAQWGDEGKGKIVDYLARDADLVVRFNGGNNAGHTVVHNGNRYPLSLLPSGLLRGKKLAIAQGVAVNPKVLLDEIDKFSNMGMKPRLIIDPRAHVVMPYHQWLDAATEESKGDKKVGSLKLGIGYCYEDRTNRHGIRMEDLIDPYILKERLTREYTDKKKRLEGVFGFSMPKTLDELYKDYKMYGKNLKPYISDVGRVVLQSINDRVLFEGAHGTFLDASFGTYPYTTAVNTISGSIFPMVGIPPRNLTVMGVVKAYTTRVGGGPFPAELKNTIGTQLQEKGQEIGTVSKRKRRCGWLDLPMLRLAHRLNGFSKLAITKLDVLTGIPQIEIVTAYKLGTKNVSEFPSQLEDVEKVIPITKTFRGWTKDISQVRNYSELPRACQSYLRYIEKALKTQISFISVGSERDSIIHH